MKKKVLFRSLFGLLSGVALGQLVAIVISALKGDGAFYAVIPELVNDFGGEQSAVIVQTVLLGVAGGIVGAASVIWELDRWSLTKQTGAHFCLFAIPFTIVLDSPFCRWRSRFDCRAGDDLCRYLVRGILLYQEKNTGNQ